VSKIVIADGRDILRRGLRDLLGSHPGWDVVAEADDGYNAVSAALQTTPDIVVIDSLLPGMNGLESAARIHQRVPRAEICFFTDCREEAVIARALRTGARGYVLKSDPAEDLVCAVEALSRHRTYYSWIVPKTLVDFFEVERPVDPPGAPALLTPREREVVQLVAEGRTNKEVGRELNLSIKTVETHRCAAMRKVGLSSTADLVRYAVRNHMVQA
jgi:DNA-binding NarL/FixJ family response regulator